MSPEALEGRMNLLDTESFKQIDIYALGLIAWEVCNRCSIEGQHMIFSYTAFQHLDSETCRSKKPVKAVVA